jgi:hypothetical protein
LAAHFRRAQPVELRQKRKQRKNTKTEGESLHARAARSLSILWMKVWNVAVDVVGEQVVEEQLQPLRDQVAPPDIPDLSRKLGGAVRDSHWSVPARGRCTW